jgi:pimeloyl-ACP methyl ester carboxylesterase
MMTRRQVWLLALVLCAGCIVIGPVTAPIATRYYNESGSVARTLLVLLPGSKDHPEDFERKGFVAAVRKHAASVDIVAVNAHWGYYKQRNIVQRLREDVIVPAKAKGYREIWLAGISLGGWGSLLYAHEYAADLTGIVVLAPFLGEEKVMREIAQAGGFQAWQPAELDPLDDQRRALQWLKRYVAGVQSAPRLYLAYGAEDRMASAQALLAAELPRERVFVVPGGHNWRAWSKLWDQLLRQVPIANASRSAARCVPESSQCPR